MTRDWIVSGSAASKLSALFLEALDASDKSLLGDGAKKGNVPHNGHQIEVTVIVNPSRL